MPYLATCWISQTGNTSLSLRSSLKLNNGKKEKKKTTTHPERTYFQVQKESLHINN